MAEENWMYRPDARTTMARLQRMSDDGSLIGGQTQPPRNSTLAAGWICCGLGIISAWVLPFAHVFFAAAFVLAIVAMATHQLRRGSILLITTVAGSVISVAILLTMVLGTSLAALNWAHAKAAFSSPGNFLPAVGNSITSLTASQPPPASGNPAPTDGASQAAAGGNGPSLPVASSPLTFTDVSMMVRTGFSDQEVIDAIKTKQLVEPIGVSQVRSLRTMGCGEKLISHLRTRAIFAAPRPSLTQPPTPFQVSAQTPAFTMQDSGARSFPTPMVRAPVAFDSSASIDYQAKDRRIQELKNRMDALDDDIRRIRANPQSNGFYYWNYAGRYYGRVDTERLNKHIKSLEQQRDELRREKWRLEGR